jgi:peptidylprolyl isomerase
MIPGFEIGILGSEDGSIPPIKGGGSRTLLIPPELAYGALGDGCLFGRADSCRIPPNSPVEITFQYRGLGY